MTEKITDLASLVRVKAEKNGGKPAVLFEQRRISYEDLDDQSSRLAHSLRKLGIARRDKVASLLFNCPEVLFLWFALAKLSAVYVPLNPALKGELLRHELKDCDAKLLVFDERIREYLTPVSGEFSHVKFVAYDRNAQYAMENVPGLHGLLEAPALEDASRPGLGDPSTIMYTSGTTGIPKGAVLPHFAYVNVGLEISRVAGSRPGDVFFAPLPLFHTSGQVMSTLPALMNDLVVALVERFHASAFWSEAARYDATVAFLLSSMTNVLFKNPPSPADRGHRIRVALTGAMPKAIWKEFEQRFGVQVVEGFGMTETCGVAIFNRIFDTRFGSVGNPLNHVEARVVNDEGVEVEINRAGELWLRERIQHTTFIEYYRRPTETASFRVGGWMRTGDLLYRDQEGYYYFVERKKDIIRVRGENVSPSFIESVLLAHPNVLEAVAVPVPSEFGDDEIKVAIKLRSGTARDPIELAKWAEKDLPYYMVPRYFEFVEEIPKTPNLKPQRFLMRAAGITAAVDLLKLGYRAKRPYQTN